MSERTAFITGGTSGIGRACAESFIQQGISVFVMSRRQEAVDDTVTALNAASTSGAKAAGAVGDVTVVSDIDDAVAACVDTFGGIDILVNNAGRGGGGPITAISDELWDNIIETNLNSVFRVTRSVLKSGKMVDDGWGRIINIASTGGKQGVALATPYSASKNGVIGMTKALGLELATTGVTVNAVCPGFVETPMAEQVRLGHAQHFGRPEAEIKKEFESRIPIGRYTTTAEAAAMVTYLASDGAGAVTCQAMNVCGGLGRY
ncbi:SDR family NAD(P)-dependent oxidoreductase [Antrihabitans cavernicola]|uniref:3-oxoacyl-[acyl-carrier-protein] reductase MabA n=1 Tax=Antrihabitans cavernicola TaxID=2495913 RepID=A0A5A7SAS1_9NOCA|nr:SDR family NAD(P)-dependent oxidoreductase [Spelaeibacter cavernicola]KAA0021673.1 SDR family NAD(P)-dependent oxidoreductase [Spelaeibacter cavernicola]